MNYLVMRPTTNERKNAVHSMRDVMVGVEWKSIHEIEKKVKNAIRNIARCWKFDDGWQKTEAIFFWCHETSENRSTKWVAMAWRHRTLKLSVNTVIWFQNHVNNLEWKSKWIHQSDRWLNFYILHYDNCLAVWCDTYRVWQTQPKLIWFC